MSIMPVRRRLQWQSAYPRRVGYERLAGDGSELLFDRCRASGCMTQDWKSWAAVEIVLRTANVAVILLFVRLVRLSNHASREFAQTYVHATPARYLRWL